MQTQVLSLLVAIVGGSFMGTYPAFIKTKAVLRAEPHPVVFQCYKSGMVFLTGFLFLIPRAISYHNNTDADKGALYIFSLWGVVSAASWVPSGICTITAVPRIGMSMTMAISNATSSVLSFMVFWLVFGSKMKTYSCGHNCTYSKAPIFLATCVLGTFVMIFSKKVAGWLGDHNANGLDSRAEVQPLLRDTSTKASVAINVGSNADSIANPALARSSPWMAWIVGMVAGLGSGAFGAMQYGLYTYGKTQEFAKYKDQGCNVHNKTHCPDDVIEMFNPVGSWSVSFGIGAAAMVMVAVAILSAVNGKAPNMHFPVLRIAGVQAGSCWVCGNFANTCAVLLGGNAVTMAQTNSACIIVSGLLGIFYYHEGGSLTSKLVWAAAAAWTLASIVLLGLEKAT